MYLLNDTPILLEFLKRRKEWKENDYKYSFHTNDCNVNIIPYRKNYLEIECIRYNDFPHKKRD